MHPPAQGASSDEGSFAPFSFVAPNWAQFRLRASERAPKINSVEPRHKDSPNTSPLIARSAIPITANGGGGRQRLFGGHPAARTALTDGREVQARPSAGLGSAGSIPHDARYEQWYGWQHLTGWGASAQKEAQFWTQLARRRFARFGANETVRVILRQPDQLRDSRNLFCVLVSGLKCVIHVSEAHPHR